MMDKVQESVSTSIYAQSSPYVQYNYRYVIVFLFAIPNISNAMLWITCAPITVQIQETFVLTSFEVSMCSNIFLVAYLFVNFPANYILDTYGCRSGVSIGTFLTLLGALMRTFIDRSFYYVIVGQTIAAIGQPFLLNAPAKIANEWFIPSHRPIATSVLSVINLLGTGIGFLLPGLIVGEDKSSLRENIEQLMIIEASFIVPGCLISLIFMRNKPPTPPSLSAQTVKLEFVTALKQLSVNKDYIILLVSFSLVLGNFNTFSTLVEQIIGPFGYSDVDSSILGGLLIFFGIIGATIFSLMVQKKQNYKNLILFSCITGLILNFVLMMCLYLEAGFVVFAIGISLIGLNMLPIIPLSFDLGCELSFPIGEAITVGTLMTGGQFVGMVQIIIFSQLKSDEKSTSYHIFIVSLILYGVSAILMLNLNQNLKRSLNEKEKDLIGSQSD